MERIGRLTDDLELRKRRDGHFASAAGVLLAAATAVSTAYALADEKPKQGLVLAVNAAALVPSILTAALTFNTQSAEKSQSRLSEIDTKRTEAQKELQKLQEVIDNPGSDPIARKAAIAEARKRLQVALQVEYDICIK